jgi:hypothetical protein
MKRVILLFTLILFVFSIALVAQGRMTHEERVKQYQEKLKLNADQTKKVDAILLKMEDKMQKMREKMQSGGDRENFRDEMIKMNNETNDAIQKILKPVQKEEFKKMMEERKNRMPGQGRGQGRGQ